LKELILAAKGRGAEVIVELDGGALRDIEGVDTRGCPSVQAAIEWGAQLVLVRGDGLIGGPACGIVLGNAEAVDRLLNRPMASAHRIDAARAAALAATLELHGDPGRAALAIPTLALATTPVENLRSRAERLAPQIGASAMVSEATAIELPVGPSGLPFRAASWAIRLRPAGMSVERLADKLRGQNPAVRGILKTDELLLDLRTVFPRQDLGLVAAFGAEDPTSSAEDPVTAPAE
jgi:L-seryl-tRNA(Ser) seleniumtransferase